jgi:uncharacterized membrane protein YkvA (DUF1232 family)
MDEAKAGNSLQVCPIEPSFPRNLLLFRRYSAIRAVSLSLFLLLGVNFVYQLLTQSVQEKIIAEEVVVQRENRGVVKRWWEDAYSWAWQAEPESSKVKKEVKERISSSIFWSGVQTLFAWCFVWLCFDWQRAKHFIFAGLSISAGILYSLLPIDVFPDFIPVVGMIDDITFNIFGTSLGLASLHEYYQKRRHKALVENLFKTSPKSAFNVALQDYGLEIKNGK